jgi:hypothetical protein
MMEGFDVLGMAIVSLEHTFVVCEKMSPSEGNRIMEKISTLSVALQFLLKSVSD